MLSKARISGGPFWGQEGSRKFLRAYGNGAAPGERFFGKVDPGGGRAGLNPLSYFPGTSDRSPTPAFVRRDHVAPMQVGRSVLVGHCFQTGHLRPFGAFALRVNSLQGNYIFRIDDPAETAREWRQAAVLKYAFSPHPQAPASRDFDSRVRARGEKGVLRRHAFGWSVGCILCGPVSSGQKTPGLCDWADAPQWRFVSKHPSVTCL